MRLAGLELGGTKCIAVLSDGPTIIERLQIPTSEPDKTLDAALGVLCEWDTAAPLAAVGVASFGPVRLDRTAADFGHILTTPKQGWRGVDLLGPLRQRLACPVAFDTDVNAAALAEYHWGAGRGSLSLVYLTIGTGVGGGIVIDGQPIHGMLHPELGHLMFRRAEGDRFPGICPFHGDCIEGLISGPALFARFSGDIHAAPGDDPRRDHLAADLAQLFAALILGLSPNKILVGGGVGLGVPGLLDTAIAKVPAILGGYLPQMDADALQGMIAQPQLGTDAGPLGAIALAQAIAADAGAQG